MILNIMKSYEAQTPIVILIQLLSLAVRVLFQGVFLGDAVLRRAFYLLTLSAIRVNPVIRRFYEGHKGKLKGKKLIVACASCYYLGRTVL
ncbi:second ORF in transposon ISC1190 [Saccharolobus solfataricus]|uniref:Second ORF in transposon ISC1190 n=1 Tax=Saccharolobus solfataricus TaxID=2287 RepID=A0A157T0A6_SACSO|nr:second ORF in transposon ISC1190 [Saccharolobus solfataricus]